MLRSPGPGRLDMARRTPCAQPTIVRQTGRFKSSHLVQVIRRVPPVRPATKTKLLWTTASLCGVAALGLAVLAFVLIKGGAYPSEGAGSLGHAGMVIAGIIAAFLGISCGGLVLVCVSHIRAIENAKQPISNGGTSE